MRGSFKGKSIGMAAFQFPFESKRHVQSRRTRLILRCNEVIVPVCLQSGLALKRDFLLHSANQPPPFQSTPLLTHRDGGQGEEVGEGARLDAARVLVGRLEDALVGRVHHDPVHRQQQLRLRAAQVEARLFPEKGKRELRG